LLREYRRKNKALDYLTLKRRLTRDLNSKEWYSLSTNILNEDKDFVIKSNKHPYTLLSIELQLDEITSNPKKQDVEFR